MTWTTYTDAEMDDYDDDLPYWNEGDDPDFYEDRDVITEMADGLRASLSEDYGNLSEESVEQALFEVMESMSAAEAFNIGKAFQQIGKTVSKAVSDPMVGQIAATVAPIAGTAVGTYFGGPVGAALGKQLGSAAANALGPQGKSPAQVQQTMAQPPIAQKSIAQQPPSVLDGSVSAAQLLALLQKPEVLQGVSAVALGQHGKKAVNGVPTGAILSMLASLAGRAAADADEIQYWDSRSVASLFEAESDRHMDDGHAGYRGDALYRNWLDAESADLLAYDAEEFAQ